MFKRKKKFVGPNGKVKSIKSLQPLHQSVEFSHINSYYTQNFAAVPTNLFRNSGAKFVTTISKQAFSKIKSATLRMNISVASSTVQLAPTPYWFESISFRPNGGQGEAVGFYYNDTMYLSLALPCRKFAI